MQNTSPTLGILGTGTIAEALTIGLSAFDDHRAQILLSPRNATIAHRLAERFPNVSVATDNQAVIDASEIVILAVRPQVAEEVLKPLHFRADQHVLSLIATFNTQQIATLVAPATEISRAVPLPPVAERRGPLALYTRSAEITRLLDGLGRLIPVNDEAHLDLISAVTSLMGTYFGMAGSVDSWLTQRGFEPEASRALVSELFLNLALAANNHQQTTFPQLSREYSTPGGLNEQAWRELQRIGWGEQLQAALDLVLNRIHGKATYETRLRPTSERGA